MSPPRRVALDCDRRGLLMSTRHLSLTTCLLLLACDGGGDQPTGDQSGSTSTDVVPGGSWTVSATLYADGP